MTHTCSNLLKEENKPELSHLYTAARQEWAVRMSELLPLVHMIHRKELDSQHGSGGTNSIFDILLGIINEGSLSPVFDNTETSKYLGDRGPAVYFFWGHVLPPPDKFDTSNAQIALLINYTESLFPEASGVPFDTGGVLNLKEKNSPPGEKRCPKSEYGKYVLCKQRQTGTPRVFCNTPDPACWQERSVLIADHTAKNEGQVCEIKKYFTLYLMRHFNDVKAYLNGSASVEIDDFNIGNADCRSYAFEVRCFDDVNVENMKIALDKSLLNKWNTLSRRQHLPNLNIFKRVIQLSRPLHHYLKKYIEKILVDNQIVV